LALQIVLLLIALCHFRSFIVDTHIVIVLSSSYPVLTLAFNQPIRVESGALLAAGEDSAEKLPLQNGDELLVLIPELFSHCIPTIIFSSAPVNLLGRKRLRVS